jgi:hypothetical protein
LLRRRALAKDCEWFQIGGFLMIDFIIHILALLLMAVIALAATTLVVAGFVGVGALFAHFTER